jgi:hypothetical protein
MALQPPSEGPINFMNDNDCIIFALDIIANEVLDLYVRGSIR